MTVGNFLACAALLVATACFYDSCYRDCQRQSCGAQQKPALVRGLVGPECACVPVRP